MLAAHMIKQKCFLGQLSHCATLIGCGDSFVGMAGKWHRAIERVEQGIGGILWHVVPVDGFATSPLPAFAIGGNDNYVYDHAMRRNVHVFVYDGFEILDMAGPVAVFGNANTVVQREAYAVSVASISGGLVTSSAGVAVQTDPIAEVYARDIVLVVGAESEPLRYAMRDESLRKWLIQSFVAGARIGSVCTGAFLLARAGLFDGRKATTHWAAREDLARLFPSVIVESDALYVEDGSIWSSAGISTGIDMALALVSRDLGPSVMHDVARRMVVYAHRPGTQSQFSELLASQRRTPSILSDLLAFIDDNLASDLAVPQLAARAGMSERTLHRKFIALLGRPPAQYVESIRIERARLLLEQGQTVKQVAEQVGYRTEQGLRIPFEARFSLSPSLHRRLHCKSLST
jgi:transcriptional regulator GlxA family with amidase domain